MSLALDLYLGKELDYEAYTEITKDDSVEEFVCESTENTITESVAYKLFEEEL